MTTPKSRLVAERQEIAKSEYHGNHNDATEFKNEELSPGQSTHEGMSNEADPIIVQVKYREEEKSVSIPKQEWTLQGLQKYVASAFSLSDPPTTLTFKIMDGGADFEWDTYDCLQTLIVVPGKAPTKLKKKIKLFINNNGKTVTLTLTSLPISFKEFKDSVKEKIKESADNFNIQIVNSINKNKLISSDADIGLLDCGETQLEVKIIRG